MPEPESGPIRVRDLSVQPRGSAVLILHGSGADDAEHQVFGTIPVGPGDGVVLASKAAIGSSGFRSALRHACRLALTAAARTRASSSDDPRLWLAVSGLGRADGRGRAQAQKLAREFSAEFFAPDGPITFVAGGTIFAGTDHHGWMRFRGNQPAELHSARYPRPPWEAWLPRGTVHDGGLHIRPVPAGLAISGSAASAEDQVSHAVAVSAAHPRLVLGSPGGEPIAPHQVAALLRRFPAALRESIQLIPATPATLSAQWLTKLAELVEHDVVAATGLTLHDTRTESTFIPDERGNLMWRPFSAMLRYSPDGSVAPVLAGPPPHDWFPAGPLHFRRRTMPEPQPTPHEVLAKVVPAGLALLPAAQVTTPGAADRLVFEPGRLTVVLGVPCEPLPLGMSDALRQLLAGFDAGQLARVRVLVLGTAAEPLRDQIRSAVGGAAEAVQFPAVMSAVVGAAADGGDRQRTPVAAAEPTARTGNEAAEAEHRSAEPLPPAVPEAGTLAETGPPTGQARDASDSATETSGSPAKPDDAEHSQGQPATAVAEPGTLTASQADSVGGGRTTRIKVASLPPRGGSSIITPAPVHAEDSGRAERDDEPGSALAGPDFSRAVTGTSIALPIPPQPSGPPELPKREPGASAMPRLSALRTARLRLQQVKQTAAREAPVVDRATDAPAAEPTTRISVARLPAAADSPTAVAAEPSTPASSAPPGPVSTEEQRAGFARQAGEENFAAALTQVRSVLAALPELREQQPPEAEANLVAVYTYLGDGPLGAVELNRTLLDGGEPSDAAACVLSGLHGLPAHQGPVHRLVEIAALERYEPGTTLTDPRFVSADAIEAVRADGFADVVIWSHTARRTSDLRPDELREEVVFPAGARFTVLDVDRGAEEPALLLAELPPDETGADEPDRLPALRRRLEQCRNTAARAVSGDALARFAAPVGQVAEAESAPG